VHGHNFFSQLPNLNDSSSLTVGSNYQGVCVFTDDKSQLNNLVICVKNITINHWNASPATKITAVVFNGAALQKETWKGLAGDGHFVVDLLDGNSIALNGKIRPTSGHCYQKLTV